MPSKDALEGKVAAALTCKDEKQEKEDEIESQKARIQMKKRAGVLGLSLERKLVCTNQLRQRDLEQIKKNFADEDKCPSMAYQSRYCSIGCITKDPLYSGSHVVSYSITSLSCYFTIFMNNVPVKCIL